MDFPLSDKSPTSDMCNLENQKETQELAFTVDTFHPLHLTKDALEFEKPEYQDTWLEGSGE